MSNAPRTRHLTLKEQKGIILEILCDFAGEGTIVLKYLDHVGFDLRTISHAKQLASAYLGHYRLRNGQYDVDRALDDLVTWPPIASRIVELQAEETERL